MHASSVVTNEQATIGIGKNFTVQVTHVLLFPGFFFYQTLLGIGLIGAYLGGYFTLVAMVLLVPLAVSYVRAVRRDKKYVSGFDGWLLVFVVYYLAVLVVNFLAGSNRMIAARYMQAIIFCFETYVVFRMIDIENKRFIMLGAVSLAVMTAITYYYSIGGFFYLQALGEAQNPDSLATYQGFARSYVYTYLVLVSVVRSIVLRCVLYGVATCALFLNGARSEFSGILFLIPMIELYYAKHRIYAFSLMVFLIGFLVAGIDEITNMLPDNRILQLLDLSHSTSGVARQHLTSNALRTIAENPVFGDFGSYPEGQYAHNVLCAWVDFGLFGIVFFLSLMIWPAAWLFFNGFFTKTRSPYFVLAWSFMCVTILWALTAKNVPDMSVGAAMGAFARYRYGKRYGCDR